MDALRLHELQHRLLLLAVVDRGEATALGAADRFCGVVALDTGGHFVNLVQNKRILHDRLRGRRHLVAEVWLLKRAAVVVPGGALPRARHRDTVLAPGVIPAGDKRLSEIPTHDAKALHSPLLVAGEVAADPTGAAPALVDGIVAMRDTSAPVLQW